MRFTTQETKVITYLTGKKSAYWEELAQFCKDPGAVKLKTVKKIVSDIRKKFKDDNQACPFDCAFQELALTPPVNEEKFKIASQSETVNHNGQTLVKVVRTSKPTPRIGTLVFGGEPNTGTIPNPVIIGADARKPYQIEFSIKKWQNQIITKSGIHNLSDEDFEVFEYLYNKHAEIVTLEELRDKVVFPLYGSKLPARWWDSIQRRINNVRRAVPELKNRIFTVKTENNGTGYLFK